jgi:hypothetical protein
MNIRDLIYLLEEVEKKAHDSGVKNPDFHINLEFVNDEDLDYRYFNSTLVSVGEKLSNRMTVNGAYLHIEVVEEN